MHLVHPEAVVSCSSSLVVMEESIVRELPCKKARVNMPFELTDKIHVNRDEPGHVRHLEHFQQPFVAANTEALRAATADANIPSVSAPTPQALAEQYLRDVAPIYGIDERMLPDQGGAEALARGAAAGGPAGSKLELTEEKEVMGTTTIWYQQTYNDLPVWEGGVSVTIQPEPMRVTASQSSVHPDVSLPSETMLAGPTYDPEASTPGVLKRLLGLTNGDSPTINGTRQLIYQYDPNQRIDPAAQAPAEGALQGGPPTLPCRPCLIPSHRANITS